MYFITHFCLRTSYNCLRTMDDIYFYLRIKIILNLSLVWINRSIRSDGYVYNKQIIQKHNVFSPVKLAMEAVQNRQRGH